MVEGQFGTWALARFGEKKKLSFPQIIELFSSDDLSIMDMLAFVICACEYKEREAGKPPFMNDIRLTRFIDDYTTDNKEEGVLMKLLRHSNDREELSSQPEAQKKTTTPIPGAHSSVNSLQPEVV